MTNEQKWLLLIDLCGRLLYGVICQLSNKDADVSIIEKLDFGGLEHFIAGSMCIKPYLRPMSSMTKEEEEEYNKCYQSDDTTTATKLIDFYNAHYLDYRGLIPMGLALEAKEGMYNF